MGIANEISFCVRCGLSFLAVDWLEWRCEGYCSKRCYECDHPPEPGEVVENPTEALEQDQIQDDLPF
jgi:hypothetical protein